MYIYIQRILKGLYTCFFFLKISPAHSTTQFFVTARLVFGALNLLNAIFVLLFIKETKGVSLEAIPDLFGDRRDKDELRGLEAELWPGAYGGKGSKKGWVYLAGEDGPHGGDELGLILLDVKNHCGITVYDILFIWDKQ